MEKLRHDNKPEGLTAQDDFDGKLTVGNETFRLDCTPSTNCGNADQD